MRTPMQTNAGNACRRHAPSSLSVYYSSTATPRLSGPLRTSAHPLCCHTRSSRPHILLVLIRTPHGLDDLLALLGAQAALLGHDLAQHGADLSRHVSRVTADVEVSLLQEQLVDLSSSLLQTLLHVNFLTLFAREGGDQLEGGAEGGGECLG